MDAVDPADDGDENESMISGERRLPPTLPRQSCALVGFFFLSKTWRELYDGAVGGGRWLVATASCGLVAWAITLGPKRPK